MKLIKLNKSVLKLQESKVSEFYQTDQENWPYQGHLEYVLTNEQHKEHAQFQHDSL